MTNALLLSTSLILPLGGPAVPARPARSLPSVSRPAASLPGLPAALPVSLPVSLPAAVPVAPARLPTPVSPVGTVTLPGPVSRAPQARLAVNDLKLTATAAQGRDFGRLSRLAFDGSR